MVGQTSHANLLLAALTPQYRASLLSRMRTVTLGPREILYEPDETPKFAHFLTSGVVSIVVSMANGASTEVGIWGREGLVESFHILGNARIPNRCIVQMESTALRMPFKELQKEFQESKELRDCILQGVQSQSAILGQLAGCNRLHEAEARLARWLLMVRDRNEADTFLITQEFLAIMLGSRRTTVTAAAGELQRKGLIRYSRGRIHISDPVGLENVACECYGTVRELYASFYCGAPALEANENVKSNLA
ncbi:Crp/Fnr family transcriptional regulator [Acidobacteria bacterium AB60]|nr:Crp/Fnr family transcriptional regulator [Acidobacteria bacterium AB60]